MECGKCALPVGDCTCPDIDDRLRTIVNDKKSPVLFKWCQTCDKHYERCLCTKPNFVLKSNGKIVPVNSVTDIFGRPVVVDLTSWLI